MKLKLNLSSVLSSKTAEETWRTAKMMNLKDFVPCIVKLRKTFELFIVNLNEKKSRN